MSILTLIEGKSSEELGNFFKKSIDDFVKEKIIETINQLLPDFATC